MPNVEAVKVSIPGRFSLFLSAIRYLTGKALTILFTIFIGVFITILVVNYPTGAGDSPNVSPFETKLEELVSLAVRISLYDQGLIYLPNGDDLYEQKAIEMTAQLREEAGLNLPFLPRNLLWTFKALTFRWGSLTDTYFRTVLFGTMLKSDGANTIVLEYLPNTLLLVGTSYLIVFLLGLPLALYLARNHGTWLDRLMTTLSPISSVPAWVFAVLLVALFAVQLRLLPVDGMYDFIRPQTQVENVIVVARHMILPVSALVLSLLFQLVYAWRTFFIIYSEEDYVELARAKGLSNWLLETQYILRPSLPYIITSFTTSLIGFWQLTVAVERVFHWPGIGSLYIDALPNYWSDRVSVGDLMIVIQIVVIFAYLLGLLVFVLDLVYVIVDPRIHLMPKGNVAYQPARVKTSNKAWMKHKSPLPADPGTGPREKRFFSLPGLFQSIKDFLKDAGIRNRLFVRELSAYPSAIFGLIVIFVLSAGSIYAVLFLPYEEFGKSYGENRVTGRNLIPSIAAPAWFNTFSRTPRLSTLILDENSVEATVSTRTLDNDWLEKTIVFDFDYQYAEMPEEVYLYLDSKYKEKFPFVSMIWVTPDGRELNLKSIAVNGNINYDFTTGVSISKLLGQNPEWKNWFERDVQFPTPAHTLLFAQPGPPEKTLVRGHYQLKITSIFFEENSDLHPQLVLLGQVYGLAGTDYWRRDLMLPLFWGMPFALLMGLLGTFATILVAMFLPAIGVWYGGWLDNFIQRLSEINMVLPGLAIAVLINLLFGVNVWIVLGIVVMLNAFGSPIKSFRSAFLQAKEAPYMEAARSYGAGDLRLIMTYLVPRIMPMFIPQLITQIPSYIFLEATLGFFSINSDYPSWGRIIYDGLTRGALYGSPFWVLEPIFLLLLTGLAFAMLGSALERILNPRIIESVSINAVDSTEQVKRLRSRWRFFAGLIALLFVVFIFINGKAWTNSAAENQDTPPKAIPATRNSSTPLPPASTSTRIPVSSTSTFSTLTPAATISVTETFPVLDATFTPPSIVTTLPALYTLQRGEYPYCLARRFNVDPVELLSLNGLANSQTFAAGITLHIPQSGRPFPGERMILEHPANYTVVRFNETLYEVACQFGDVDPLAIAQMNDISVDSVLTVGRVLKIP